MITKLRLKFPALLGMALSLVLWSCDDLSEPTSPLAAPSVASHTDGIALPVSAYRPLRGDFKGTRGAEVIVKEKKGGFIEVQGTSLEIPAGAVLNPTLFRLEVAKKEKDGLTPVQYELRAFEQDALGYWTVDVGARGFLKPVKLRASYAWATDTVLVPELLRIVWMKNDGTQEVYHSDVDPSGKAVTAWLSHFSDYAIGFPN